MTCEIALSVILPVHNEVENLPILWAELVDVLPGLAEPVEVLFVDDGSTDGSGDVIRRLAEGDPRIRPLRLEWNAGLSAAFYAGFQAARGRIMATMGNDLQAIPATSRSSRGSIPPTPWSGGGRFGTTRG